MADEIKQDELEAMMAEIETGSETTAASVGAPDVAQPPKEPAGTMERVRVGSETMLKRFVDTDTLKKDVSINPSDLDSAMVEHASLYVHYATMTVAARRQYERLKNAFEILEARLDGEMRTDAATSGKKITEAAIRSALISDRRWSVAQAKVIEAQSIWKMCEVAESALVQRKDLILEIARDRRKEREGEMHVRASQDMRDRVVESLTKKAA